jgi:hypothetical protein
MESWSNALTETQIETCGTVHLTDHIVQFIREEEVVSFTSHGNALRKVHLGNTSGDVIAGITLIRVS